MANKFKVGDIVVGNEKASWNYGVTKRGVKLKVTQVNNNGSFVGIIISEPRGKYVGQTFGVGCELKPECFDLVTEGDKIVITTDGVTTTAKMYCGKTVIKKAEAKCAPGDKFDFEFGARLAMDRLVKDTKSGRTTINDVIDSMTKKQKDTMYYLVGQAIRKKDEDSTISKVLSIEDFDWNDFKSGKCAIMIHTRTAYDEILRRIKRRFCPAEHLDIIGSYGGSSGYLYYGKDEKLRFITTTPDIDYIEASKFFKKRINMSDDDWKAFDNSNMTIRVTKDVEDDVLLTLKCLGYTWRSSADMTSWTPGISEYYLTKDVVDGLIGFMVVDGLDVLSTPPQHVSSVKIVKKI